MAAGSLNVMTLSDVRDAFSFHDEPGTLVVVEGVPGAGKTSAIAAVASGLGAATLPEIDHVTHQPPACPHDQDTLAEWYVDAELRRQQQLREVLRSNRIVIQDRCVLSTVAFAFARSAAGSREARRRLLQRLTDGPKFVMPDAIIILDVDVATSLSRRRSYVDDKRYRIWFDPIFLARFRRFYHRTAHRLMRCTTISFDTSAASPQMVGAVLRQFVVTQVARRTSQ